MRQLVQEAAAAQQWTISVDRFATEANALVPRFNSLDAEPASEQQDALSVTDWDTSLCPACGHYHREVNFIFPTRTTLLPALRKLEADHARGILLLPYKRRATYWPTLQAAMPTNARKAIYTVKADRLDHLPPSYSSRLILLAVDFAADPAPPASGTPTLPPCGQEAQPRPPESRISPGDARDFAAMRLQIERHCTNDTGQ